jgi:hypothetical protein
MSGILIRDVDPDMRRELKERARRSNRSLSDEVKELVRWSLNQKPPERTVIPPGKLGTYMFSLLPDEFRGDDLVFEVQNYPKAPDFE